MARYADPTRCPDCAVTIDPVLESCPTCGLLLRGATAHRLFETLSSADALLVSLRAASTSPAPSPTPALPAHPPTRTRRRRPGAPRLEAVSVPRILLTLGAGCLLVAALVFIVVAWSGLGVGGRTAGLVALTLAAGVLAARFARQDLRGSAEALSVVGLGLLTLDVVGADHAGWLAGLSTQAVLDLLGALLFLTASAGAVAARRTPLGRLTGAEVVATLGVALLATGVSLEDRLTSASVALLLATAVAAAATAGLHLLGLRVARVGGAVVTVLAWVWLTGYALARAFANDASWSLLWGDGHVWPVLVSAALAGAVAAPNRLGIGARLWAAAAAQLLLVCAALAPAENLSRTGVTLVGLGVLAGAAAVTLLLPRPWGRPSLLTQLVVGVAVLGAAVVQLAHTADRLADLVDPVWGGRAGDRLAPGTAGHPAGWLLPLCVLALLTTGWAVARAHTGQGSQGEEGDQGRRGGRDWLRPALTVLAGSVVAGGALYPVPVWLLLGGLLGTAAGLVAWWLVDDDPGSVACATVPAAAGLVLALHAPWLGAGAAVTVVALAGLVHTRGGTVRLSAVAGMVLACSVAGSVWSLDGGLDRAASPSALDALLVLGALVLLAPYAPRVWWRCPDPVRARSGLELAAAVVALGLMGTGVVLAPSGEGASWTAVYLTVAGVVSAAMALLRRDRRVMRHVGFVLLAAATWARLADLGVRAPEAYTLPSAVVLVALGWWHLRDDPTAGTLQSVGAGLGLALVPSLLWSLADPTGPRVLLLGLGCLVLVLAGTGLHASAPLVWGAAVGGVLVLRLTAPYVGDALPRWVLIGAAGALLISLGATWERRLGEARVLGAYVRGLR